jgi:hypothetical protein
MVSNLFLAEKRAGYETLWKKRAGYETLWKKRAGSETLWKNILQPERPQMKIWRMRIAHWVSKATNTHSRNT